MKRLKAECEMVLELLEACNEKIKVDPNNIEVMRLRSVLLLVANSFDEAIKDLDRIISTMPNDETAYYLRSDCHLNIGEYDLAKQDYLRALKIQFKEDTELVKGYTEQVILNAKMENEEEKKDIMKILDYEKKRALLTFIPQLED